MDFEGLLWPSVYLVLLVRCLTATRDECFRSGRYENTRKGKVHERAFFLILSLFLPVKDEIGIIV